MCTVLKEYVTLHGFETNLHTLHIVAVCTVGPITSKPSPLVLHIYVCMYENMYMMYICTYTNVHVHPYYNYIDIHDLVCILYTMSSNQC